MEFLTWIEGTAIATWVRESLSLWAYPTIISLHALGMALLVGLNAAIDLRILGAAPNIPIQPLEKLFPCMWWALLVNTGSGTLLIMASAEKMLTMPVFYIKLLFIVIAVVVLLKLKHRVFGVGGQRRSDKPVSRNGRILAAASLASWCVALIAGRLTAYPLLLAGN